MTKEELEEAIRNADACYYRNGSSPYSDTQYDNMKNLLREMDPENELLKSLGEDHVDGFRKIRHERRMLSLEKAHEQIDTEEVGKWKELSDWFRRISDFDRVADQIEKDAAIGNTKKALFNGLLALIPPFRVFVEPKVDGMSAEALYVDGKLQHISTRGNGDEGDDITDNVRHLFPETVRVDLDHVPGGLPPNKKYPVISSRFLLRGELYISKEEFARINAEQEKAGLETFKNPRNLCAGTVKSKDGLQGRKVSFVVHDYVDLTGALEVNPGTAMSVECSLRNLGSGVDVVPHICPGPTYMDVFKAVEEINKRRDEFPYVIDGAVIKTPDLWVRKRLGETEHHPKWAVAFKFLPERKETTINSITWQIGGKTGKAVPVGEIEPVILDGTVVSRVSLANAGRMAARGIAPGVKVLICKSGEIIPDVAEVLTPVEVHLEPTMRCPSCGAEMPLEHGKSADTANYICPNPNCREKAIAALKTAFGSSGLNVMGFGPEIAASFVDAYGTANGLPDLVLRIITAFKSEYPADIDGKILDNLYAELGVAQNAPLHRWIAALQFQGIATGTAKKISQQCVDWCDFELKLEAGELGLTDKQTEAFNARMPQVRDAIIRNSRLTFNPKSDNYVDLDAVTESKLGGKAFVVTGRFETGRGQIEYLVGANGGILRSSVSKKTDYLVVGEDVGATKTKKAAECGTKVITEHEFLEMLQ